MRSPVGGGGRAPGAKTRAAAAAAGGGRRAAAGGRGSHRPRCGRGVPEGPRRRDVRSERATPLLAPLSVVDRCDHICGHAVHFQHAVSIAGRHSLRLINCGRSRIDRCKPWCCAPGPLPARGRSIGRGDACGAESGTSFLHATPTQLFKPGFVKRSSAMRIEAYFRSVVAIRLPLFAYAYRYALRSERVAVIRLVGFRPSIGHHYS